MTKTRYYCDKCGKEITDFNELREYTVRWDSEYFNHPTNSTKILLCKECAMDFHKNVLHCRRRIKL